MNNGENFGTILTRNLADASEFHVLSAYLNENGLNHVLNSIQKILDGNGKVSVVHGLYPSITEPRAIRRLTELEMDYTSMKYGVFVDPTRSVEGKFHPKLYLTQSDESDYRAVIGSSNLTRGGLTSNLEINCTLTGSDSSPVIKQCREAIDKIHSDPSTHLPTAEWIDRYEELREVHLKNDSSTQQQSKELFEGLYELGQRPPWVPITKFDFVVKAVQNLEQRGPSGKYFHLSDITEEAWRISEGRYGKLNFDATVRHHLNRNTVYLGGKSKLVFERSDGADGRSGEYRLSDRGRQYRTD